MGSWPHTRLHVGLSRCVAISGPYIQVLDRQSGDHLHTTRCATKILCSAVDSAFEHIVTVSDDKKLFVWALDGLRMKSSRELPKKSTAIQITQGEQKSIVIADKFGDVFCYPFEVPSSATPTPTPQPAKGKGRDSLESHDNPHGTLLLGHTSIITCVLFSADRKYIITADRDEHIRVSRYPLGYVIERYCLGHEHYVSVIAIPTFDPSTLISGGGDPYLNFWDWMSGEVKCRIPIGEVVQPFLRVNDSKEKRMRARKMDGKGSLRKRRKARKRAKKGGEAEEHGDVEGEMEVETMIIEENAGSLNNNEMEGKEEDAILALAKMEAVEIRGQRLVVFIATGGCALFYFTVPSNYEDIPPIQHVDVSRPVLDFEMTSNGQIFVSVDAAWPIPAEDISATYVHVLEWREDELRLVEEAPSVVKALNTTALQEASPSDLSSLELYAALLSLPRHAADQDEDAVDTEDLPSRPDTPEIGLHGDSKKPMSARTAGRLKSKEALLRKQQAHQANSNSLNADEREAKKAKLDQED